MKLMVRILLLSIVVCSCDASKKTIANNGNLLASLEKTECRGKCPVYSIKIYQDGRVTLTGTKNFGKIGNFCKQLSGREITKLDTAFSEADFFKLEKEYADKITDLPTTYISYSRNDNTMRVRDYYGAPPRLKRLEKMLEDIATSEKGWQSE